MSVGVTVRAQRTALGWSQEKLAEVAGIHRVTVVNIESGESVPTLDTLRLLAQALGVQPGDLLNQPDAPAEGAA